MKPDISRFSLGVTASGSLYSGVRMGDAHIEIATVDFEAGKLLAGPAKRVGVGNNGAPQWSPDGKYLAYRSNRPPPVYNVFVGNYSLETGLVRELQPKLTYFENIRWAPDWRSFTVEGKDLQGRQGVYQVDAQTAEVRPIAAPASGRTSLDGRKFYYRKNLATDGFAFVERDLASGYEREIFRRKGLGGLNLSPDGRFIATPYRDETTKSSGLLLISISGGEPQELLKASQPSSLVAVFWMPDGRAILVNKALNDSQNELLLVPTAGGQPRKVDLGVTRFAGFAVHPDGKQIAYVVGGRGTAEVWALENFLPTLNAKK